MLRRASGNTKLARRLLRVAGFVDAWFLLVSLCFAFTSFTHVLWFLFCLAVANAALAWYAISQGVIFEWMAERTFKEVCSGIGFEAEAPSWRNGAIGRLKGETKTVQPNLRCVRGDGQAFTGLISPFPGQTVEDYQEHAEAFAHQFDVQFCSFERAGGGYILMRVGDMQVPEAYSYEELADANPAPFDLVSVLQAVPMARDMNYKPFYMPIEGNHLLIVGRTGAGKSSWVWSLVFGLADARRAGLVRFWGLDPKKVELGYGREWWDEYADTIESMIELLEKAVNELLDRNAAIQGKARKIKPSPEMPLNVIVIDELAYLSAFISDDKKLLARANNAMKTILAIGRATGYVLVGCSQDPRKEVLGFRDLFPTKVGLAMEAEMVDLVFGKGAHDNGAYCEQIPMKAAGAGCAYVKEEMTNKPVLVRAAWCSDEAIKNMAMPQQQLMQASPIGEAYQQVFGQEDVPQLDFNNQPLEQVPQLGSPGQSAGADPAVEALQNQWWYKLK